MAAASRWCGPTNAWAPGPACPIYNALDPETHHPVAPDQRFAAELGFLGNRLPDREARVDEFFFAAAEALPQARFLLGGAGWGDRPDAGERPLSRPCRHGRPQRLQLLGRAVLNINRASMAAYGFSPPTRVFEAAGAGACLITDAWAGIEQFLEPGREILVARDGAEVARHVLGLGQRRAQARSVPRRGRACWPSHTYAQRAALVEAVLDGREPREAAA